MRNKQHKKLVHKGQYAAEVKIELIDTDEGWSSYLSLDDERNALRRRNLHKAGQLARGFTLTPPGLYTTEEPVTATNRQQHGGF